MRRNTSFALYIFCLTKVQMSRSLMMDKKVAVTPLCLAVLDRQVNTLIATRMVVGHLVPKVFWNPSQMTYILSL